MPKKLKRYNSDFMSRKMDEQLGLLEEKLTALYANAANGVKAEFTDFMAQYEAKDLQKRAMVEAGKITEAEYEAWRANTILTTEKYKATVASITDMLVHTDVAAMALVRGELPLVVAESYNFTKALGFYAADKAGLSQGTFEVYNARTVQSLLKDNKALLPSVNLPEDKKWNKDRINREITQGIVKGESIPDIADRLQAVTNMDRNAAIRNARTAMTGAENMGRSEAAADMREKGVPVKEQWSATLDDRTRETHLLLDGTYKDEEGYFGVGIIETPLQYPADPAGDPEEIYNCRCRLSIRLGGIDHSQDGDLYEKFMKENWPEDYKAMKTSERELDRAEQRYDAIQSQADMRAGRRI